MSEPSTKLLETAETLESAILETLGFASVCWDEKGVFQPEACKLAMNTLINWMQAHPFECAARLDWNLE